MRILFIGQYKYLFIHLAKALGSDSKFFLFRYNLIYYIFYKSLFNKNKIELTEFNVKNSKEKLSLRLRRLAIKKILESPEYMQNPGEKRLRRLYKKVRYKLVSLEVELKKSRPDVVVTWNGDSYYEQIIIDIAKKILPNLRVICYELGFKRPNTIVIDENGVNYKSNFNKYYLKKSHIIERDDSESNLIVQHKTMPDSYWVIFRVFNALAKLSVNEMRSMETFGSWTERFIDNYFRSNKTGSVMAGSRKKILIALQVNSDSQIIKYSIKNQIECLEMIHNFIEEEKSILIEYEFYVKQHPLHRIKIPKHLLKYITLVSHRISSESLVAKMHRVVTINSTVGVEALRIGTPVGCLGMAFYAQDGMAVNLMHFEKKKFNTEFYNFITKPIQLSHEKIKFLDEKYLTKINPDKPFDYSLVTHKERFMSILSS